VASAGIFTGFSALDALQQKKNSTSTPWWRRERAKTPSWISKLPESLQHLATDVTQSWQQMPYTQRTLYSIIAANFGVALLWRIRPLQVVHCLHHPQSYFCCSSFSQLFLFLLYHKILEAAHVEKEGKTCVWLQGFMLHNFVQHLPPQRPNYITFFTSNFSHAGVMHLAINMLALSSFGSVLVEV
jgi:hypothetical protein